jgi:hypothetical protein
MYDLEDLISEIVTKLVMEVGKWNPERGQVSTFVWTVSENFCRSLVSAHMCPKRQHIPVPLSEVAKGWKEEEDRRVKDELSRNQNYQDTLDTINNNQEAGWVEARRGFEALLRDASDDLRMALDHFITERPEKHHGLGSEAVQELRFLVTKHKISREALQLVLQRG